MWYSAVRCIVTLALGLFLVPDPSHAQPPTKVHRIGYLSAGSPQFAPNLEILRQGLRELGYVEGQNLVVEQRWAEGKEDRLPDLAAELARLKPDIIVTGGNPGVRAAQQATTTIPIVLTGACCLVENGIVASLAHPGGNITGLENNTPDLDGKRLELLKEVLPQTARVAFLFNSTNPTPGRLARKETDARALGLQMQPVGVRQPDELDAAFAAIVANRPDVLFIADDTLFYVFRQQIMDFAATHRLPTLSGERRFAEAGSLIAYGYSGRDLAQRAAVYVDKILKGARPGDLPIERPMKFELIINLKTAQILGLTIPPTLLFQADEVIQ
jgi:ABC-type uncharacterized transport system substrate-binding protein